MYISIMHYLFFKYNLFSCKLIILVYDVTADFADLRYRFEMIDSCRKEIQRGVKYILIGDKSKISETRKQIVETKDAKRVNSKFFSFTCDK